MKIKHPVTRALTFGDLIAGDVFTLNSTVFRKSDEFNVLSTTGPAARNAVQELEKDVCLMFVGAGERITQYPNATLVLEPSE